MGGSKTGSRRAKKKCRHGEQEKKSKPPFRPPGHGSFLMPPLNDAGNFIKKHRRYYAAQTLKVNYGSKMPGQPASDWTAKEKEAKRTSKRRSLKLVLKEEARDGRTEPGSDWTTMDNRAKRRSKARRRKSTKRCVEEEEKARNGAAEDKEVDLASAASGKCRRRRQGRARLSGRKYDSKIKEPTLETTKDYTAEKECIFSALGSTRDARAYSSTRRASHRRLLEETTAFHDLFDAEAHHCVDVALEKHDATEVTRESRRLESPAVAGSAYRKVAKSKRVSFDGGWLSGSRRALPLPLLSPAATVEVTETTSRRENHRRVPEEVIQSSLYIFCALA